MKLLITGTAGFIGYHLTKKLLSLGHEVVGLDQINSYYDPRLKFDRLLETGIQHKDIAYNRLVESHTNPGYRFIQLNLEDKDAMSRLFAGHKFDKVVNLAAQAGVRYSLENPHTYIHSNIEGFLNILEGCRHTGVGHLVYASSSSVYGLNENMPFSVRDNVDHPVSLYAVSKKSNELMAHSYSHLFGLPTTGLRFFTVYGPWGRPDMALFIFTRAILEGKPIDIYNNGEMERDFTYIDDIVGGIVNVIGKTPSGNPDWTGTKPDPSTSRAPYNIHNIGNNNAVRLLDFVSAIEEATGRKAIKNFMPIQPGDVLKTWADVTDLATDYNYKPHTPVREGIKQFVEWYKKYYNLL